MAMAGKKKTKSKILFLSHGYIPSPNTIFNNVYSLLPGKYVVLKKDSFTISEYFSIVSEIENKKEVYNNNLLIEGIRKQLVSDAKIGTFFSGGIDSSIITYEANKLNKDLFSYSINFKDYGKTIREVFNTYDYKLSIEPGRSLVANSGVLVTKIIYIKNSERKNFLIVDGAMNDFIRPTLYNAHHNIEPLIKSKNKELEYDVVGPICETGDYFIKDLKLNQPMEGQFLAIFSTGAYGSVMSSNYNSRPSAGELLVHNNKIHLLRKQEVIEYQIQKEILPDL